MTVLESLGKYRNTGILLMRVGLGITFMVHGFPKLAGGPETWEGIGSSMKIFGLDFFPLGWGFLAAVSEFIGGLFLVLGLFFRLSVLSLLATMTIAASVHLNKGEGFSGASHAIELAIVMLGLLFIGPGKYSVDKK